MIKVEEQIIELPGIHMEGFEASVEGSRVLVRGGSYNGISYPPSEITIERPEEGKRVYDIYLLEKGNVHTQYVDNDVPFYSGELAFIHTLLTSVVTPENEIVVHIKKFKEANSNEPK